MVGYPRNVYFDNINGAHFGPAEITPEQDIYGIDSSETRSLLEGNTDDQCYSAKCNERDTGKVINGVSYKGPNPPKMGPPTKKTCCYICGYPAFQRGGKITDTFSVQCEHLIPVAALSSLCTLSNGGGDSPFLVSYEKFKELSGLSSNDYSDYETWRNVLHMGRAGDKIQIEGGGIHGTVYLWAHPSCNEIKGNFPFIPLQFSPGSFSFLKDNGTTVAAAAGGGGEQKMKGGMILESQIRDCISLQNLSWLLGSLVGLNLPHPEIKDGGSKSIKFRKSICGLGDEGNLVNTTNFENKLKEGRTEWNTDKKLLKQFPFAETGGGEGCDIKKIQLWQNGECRGWCSPAEWVDGRIDYIMKAILIPLVKNICTDPKTNKGPISSDRLQLFHNISVSTTALRIKDKVVKLPKSLVYKSKGQISQLSELIQSCELWEKMIDIAKKNCKIKSKTKKDETLIKQIKKSLKDPVSLAKIMGPVWKKAIAEKLKKIKPKTSRSKTPAKTSRSKTPAKTSRSKTPAKTSRSKTPDKTSSSKTSAFHPGTPGAKTRRSKTPAKTKSFFSMGKRKSRKTGGADREAYDLEAFCRELYYYLINNEDVFDLINHILSQEKSSTIASTSIPSFYVTNSERNIGIILSRYFNDRFDDDMLFIPQNGQIILNTLLDITQYNTEELRKYITDISIGRITRSKKLLDDKKLQNLWSEILYNDLQLPDLDRLRGNEIDRLMSMQVSIYDPGPMSLMAREQVGLMEESKRKTLSMIEEEEEGDEKTMDLSPGKTLSLRSEGETMDVSPRGTTDDKAEEVVTVDMDVRGVHDYTPSHDKKRQKIDSISSNKLQRASTLEGQVRNPELEQESKKLHEYLQLAQKKKPKKGKKSTKKKPKKGKKSTKKKPKRGKKSKH